MDENEMANHVNAKFYGITLYKNFSPPNLAGSN